MVNSESKNNEVSNDGGEFFGAVSKNLKAFVGNSKRKIKNQIARRGITKNNIALFRCWPNGKRKIETKLINRPRFKLTHYHHIVLTEAGLNFLAQGEIAH